MNTPRANRFLLPLVLGGLVAFTGAAAAAPATGTDAGDQAFRDTQEAIGRVCSHDASQEQARKCYAAVVVLMQGTSSEAQTATLCELGEPANTKEAERCEEAKRYRDRLLELSEKAGHYLENHPAGGAK